MGGNSWDGESTAKQAKKKMRIESLPPAGGGDKGGGSDRDVDLFSSFSSSSSLSLSRLSSFSLAPPSHPPKTKKTKKNKIKIKSQLHGL